MDGWIWWWWWWLCCCGWDWELRAERWNRDVVLGCADDDDNNNNDDHDQDDDELWILCCLYGKAMDGHVYMVDGIIYVFYSETDSELYDMI